MEKSPTPKRPRYDAAFRAEALRLTGESRSPPAAARALNIRPELLYQWQRAACAPLPADVAARHAFLRVQLVNEGGQPVYFDSLTLRHPRPALYISQENHYYPFGLALGGAAANTVPAEAMSKAQYNGGSLLEDELLDAGEAEGANYATPYRRYDPTIGRLLGVDPLADMYADLSPGHFAFNDPVNFNDPSGADGSPADEAVRIAGLMGNSTLVYASGGDGGGGFGEGGGPPKTGPHGEELVEQDNGQLGYYTSTSTIQNGQNVVIGGFQAVGAVLGGGAQGSLGSFFQAAWNSDFVRSYIVPDRISLGISATAAGGVGVGGSANIVLLTRGPDAGLHNTVTITHKRGLEFSVGPTLGFGSRVNGLTGGLAPVREIFANSMSGNGMAFSVNTPQAGLAVELGLGDKNAITWAEASVSPTIARWTFFGGMGASGGFTETWVDLLHR